MMREDWLVLDMEEPGRGRLSDLVGGRVRGED